MGSTRQLTASQQRLGSPLNTVQSLGANGKRVSMSFIPTTAQYIDNIEIANI